MNCLICNKQIKVKNKELFEYGILCEACMKSYETTTNETNNN